MRSLNVAIVGGGPAGLFLARLLRLHDPHSAVVVYERNPRDATYGFGVVFSPRTLSTLQAADAETYDRMRDTGVSWTEMDLCRGDELLRYGGHGMTAISRRTLLRILREQAEAVGAEIRTTHDLPHLDSLAGADVVALASGANCALRDGLADGFGTEITTGGGKYIWFGTQAPFDKVSFSFETTEFGSFSAHAYPYEPGMSTYIITTDEGAWRAAGMDASTERCQEPGRSDEYARALMERVFRNHLGGAPLIVNNTKWATFRVVRNRRLWHRNMVLLGDAAHTAHPSVGSGTKMAMEDSIALADALVAASAPEAAFAAYEAARGPVTARTQRLAEPSMYWWETFGARTHMELRQLGFHYLTRTRAITLDGLRRRDPASVADIESWFAAQAGGAGGALGMPFGLGGERLRNRVVRSVAGMDEGARQLVAGYAAAGAGLVVADWTERGATAGEPIDSAIARDWKSVVDVVRGHGSAPAVAIEAGDDDAVVFAAAMGVNLLEVAVEDRHDPWITAVWLRWLASREGGPLVIARTHCPAEPVWTEQGERFLRRCRGLAEAGAAAFHLTGGADGADAGDSWRHAVDYADRVRAELRTPTLVDGPDGWAMGPVPATEREDWATRIHTALLAGRIDLVATWPLK